MNTVLIKTKLGLRIKAFRTEKNLTQEQLSEIIELKPSNMSNIENGKTSPGFSTLCKLISKADIEPNYLLGFLRKDNVPYDSTLLEIIKLVSEPTLEQQQSLKTFLSTLK